MNHKTFKRSSFSLVSENELPFHCPPKEAQKWNMHPKVFLTFDEEGTIFHEFGHVVHAVLSKVDHSIHAWTW